MNYPYTRPQTGPNSWGQVRPGQLTWGWYNGGYDFYGTPVCNHGNITDMNRRYWDRVRWFVDECRKRDLMVLFKSSEPLRWKKADVGKTAVQERVTYLDDAYLSGYCIGEALVMEADWIIWMLGYDWAPHEWARQLIDAQAEGITEGICGAPGYDGRADYERSFMSFHPRGNVTPHPSGSTTLPGWTRTESRPLPATSRPTSEPCSRTSENSRSSRC